MADTSAQRVIVSSILGVYPNLHIVGEEDESVEVDIEYQRKLRNDLLNGHEWTTPTTSSNIHNELPPKELEMDQVTVYVDPLDGTREFVEGRLDNVQSLIGVCYKGKPLCGAIGLPFPSLESGNSTEVVFGLIGKELVRYALKREQQMRRMIL